MSAAREPRSMRTLTLGPSGTYSHRAARAVADGEIAFRESVTAVVEAVAAGETERGVVPVENSIEGSVTESLDALASTEVAVLREVVTPIRHALLARDEDFDRLASHSQALAQCRAYLEREHPDAEREAVAVHTVVDEDELYGVIDDVRRRGAGDVLVTEIERLVE